MTQQSTVSSVSACDIHRQNLSFVDNDDGFMHFADEDDSDYAPSQGSTSQRSSTASSESQSQSQSQKENATNNNKKTNNKRLKLIINDDSNDASSSSIEILSPIQPPRKKRKIASLSPSPNNSPQIEMQRNDDHLLEHGDGNYAKSKSLSQPSSQKVSKVNSGIVCISLSQNDTKEKVIKFKRKTNFKNQPQTSSQFDQNNDDKKSLFQDIDDADFKTILEKY